MQPTPTIGLFGTCGNSIWRDAFVEAYTKRKINFFNPLKEGWSPEDALVEAEHLISDELILFPVTSETFGVGSLAEIGFSIISAIQGAPGRQVLVLIDKQVSAELKLSNPIAAKDSNNCRALVRAHLAKLDLPYVEVVDTLAQLLARSLVVYDQLKK